MKFKILLFIISATVFTACNTAYKSGQTPDDVYYSPAKVIEEETQTETETEKETQKEIASQENIEDREIRMRIRDRRWRDMDYEYECNCSCDYPPYKYGNKTGYYYNPYYSPYPVYMSNSKYVLPKNYTTRKTNLNAYSRSVTPVVNSKTGKTVYVQKENPYNNTNQSATREVLTPSTNNRTYSPSTSSSNNSSGSGKSVSRPVRN
ncbi:MAG: hypothetical protein WKF35_05520 [Ferruginibacter sp.]